MDLPIKPASHRFPIWPQWLAAVEMFLITTTLGLTIGWVSPYLAKFSKQDSQLQISKEQSSWIASIVCISRIAGAILESILVNTIGSKSTTLISGIFFALGWMCFYIENSVTSIYVYRIMCGLAIGITYNAFPLYIAEISDPKIRGALLSFIMQGVMVGNLIGNTMGAYLDTWDFATISLVPNLLFLILFYFLPHSPHHLLRHNKIEEAAKSILWYNRNADVMSELAALQKFLKNSSSTTFVNRLRDLMTPINRKTLTMLLLISGFFQFSGLNTVTAYMEIMLTKAQVTVIAPATMVIIVSSLGIVSSWISIYTNDKFGRTIMLTLSTSGVATGMFLWGLNYQLLDLGFNNPNLQWMSLIAAVLYKIFLAIGLLTIPCTLISEMLAPNVKSFGVGIIMVLSSLFSFIGSKTYQPMVESISEKYVFWIYSTIMLSAAIYTTTYVPETKGKTLAEIQELFATCNEIKKSGTNQNIQPESRRMLEIRKDKSELTMVI